MEKFQISVKNQYDMWEYLEGCRGLGTPCVRPWIKLNQATYLLLRSLFLFCSLQAIGILWLPCPGWVTRWRTMVEYRHAFLKELMSRAEQRNRRTEPNKRTEPDFFRFFSFTGSVRFLDFIKFEDWFGDFLRRTEPNQTGTHIYFKK